MQLVLTTELLIAAYRQGLFPMAYSAGSPFIHWVCPPLRGQLPIADLHIPRSLKKTLRKGEYKVTIDQSFEAVIGLCAESVNSRPETWINDPIIKAYTKLYEDGVAHSVEVWREGELVGGLYGLQIGAAFFGESMFSRATDASKVALIHLVARLWKGGFQMMDTQFVNDHLQQFGVYEIPHREYVRQLRQVVEREADFELAGVNEREILDEYLNHPVIPSEVEGSSQ